MTPKRECIILSTAIGTFVVAIMLIAIWKYQHFLYNGFDLAIYNQVFWNTVHGNWFGSSIHPPNYLGDHAEWLILLLAPFYALVQHPLTLVFLQAVALAVSAIPICLIAKNYKLKPTTYKLIPALWLLNPYVWNLALYEFHLLVFAIPLLLFAAYFFITKRFVPFLFLIIGALLAREDVAFAVMGFSALALIERRRVKWFVIPLILSALVFILDQKIIAHVNPDAAYKYLIYYQWLDGALTHPSRVLTHLWSFGNLELIIAALLPLLALPLRKPRFLLIAVLPLFELLMTEPGGNFLVLQTQYSALLLPGLFIAAIEGMNATQNNTMSKHHDRDVLTYFAPSPLIPFLLIIATVYTFFALGPGGALFEGTRNKTQGARTVALQEAITRVPEDASVASSFDPLVNFSSRKNIYSLHYVWIGKKQFGFSNFTLPDKPDYLLLDTQDFLLYALAYPKVRWIAPHMESGDNHLRALVTEGNYGIVFEKNGIALMQRGVGTGVLPDAYTNAFYKNRAEKNTGGLEIGRLGETRLVIDGAPADDVTR